ncbi:MAG: phage holin family protein [Longimicrobiales bacterium]
MRFLIRLVITAVALWVAVELVPGITHTGTPVQLLLVALVFGVLNAAIRPVLLALTCPLVLITLGLFVFVLNAFMLWLTGAASQALGLGFSVDGFLSALLGGLIVGFVSTVLNIVVGDREKKEESR